MTAQAAATRVPHPGLGSTEFVAMVASFMAVNALAIDTMLPALPTIAKAVGLVSRNQQQWIVTAYLLGFGAAQLIYGTLADRYGRRPVLLVGLAIYAVCSLVAASATSFEMLIAARVVQGIGAAATRVLAVSIVRDCYAGSRMARVMSFAFIVFLAVPIFAPSIGQLVMLFGPWRWIFAMLALLSIAVMIWVVLRLPETLRPEDRIPIEPKRVWAAYRFALTNRTAVGYMLGMTMMMGSLFGFVNSAQQIFVDLFGFEHLFTLIFAMIAFGMALASLLNARVVVRLGARRVSHLALAGFIVSAIAHAAVALAGLETVWTFALFQGCTMFAFGLVGSNFGSLAMGPLGHLAGTASSIQGFITTLGGAVLGFYLGQHFDGTTVPFAIGVATYGVLALICVVFAEKGRLFQTQATPAMLTPEAAAH